ncbi:MAG: hypothetical protein HWE20_01800 [Gammaproteobacteria bacterium]|nr:hypothetical protein [Gammaproteobacteria bacterium]
MEIPIQVGQAAKVTAGPTVLPRQLPVETLLELTTHLPDATAKRVKLQLPKAGEVAIPALLQRLPQNTVARLKTVLTEYQRGNIELPKPAANHPNPSANPSTAPQQANSQRPASPLPMPHPGLTRVRTNPAQTPPSPSTGLVPLSEDQQSAPASEPTNRAQHPLGAALRSAEGEHIADAKATQTQRSEQPRPSTTGYGDSSQRGPVTLDGEATVEFVSRAQSAAADSVEETVRRYAGGYQSSSPEEFAAEPDKEVKVDARGSESKAATGADHSPVREALLKVLELGTPKPTPAGPRLLQLAAILRLPIPEMNVVITREDVLRVAQNELLRHSPPERLTQVVEALSEQAKNHQGRAVYLLADESHSRRAPEFATTVANEMMRQHAQDAPAQWSQLAALANLTPTELEQALALRMSSELHDWLSNPKIGNALRSMVPGQYLASPFAFVGVATSFQLGLSKPSYWLPWALVITGALWLVF